MSLNEELEKLHRTGRKHSKYYITENKLVYDGKKIDLPFSLGTSNALSSVIGPTWVELDYTKGKYVIRYFSKKYGLVKEEKISRDVAYVLAMKRYDKDKDVSLSHLPKIDFDKLLREARAVVSESERLQRKRK